jgi:hypothetical protein
MCNKGDDSLTVISEPNASKSGPCIFEFVVDSSVVCAYQNMLKSSSSGGHHPSSSAVTAMSSSSAINHPICHLQSPSYQAPFDLGVTETLSAPSVVFSGGNYYIHPCGQLST